MSRMRSEQRFHTTVKPFTARPEDEDNSLLIGDIADLVDGLADYD